MQADISVIIPNYNGQATLSLCLSSIVNSRGVHFEIIVVDDGSNDDSLAVIKQFPCRIIKQSHQGASAARNAGARAARSNVLFFTDADCVLAEDTLSKALSSLDHYGHQTIVGGSYESDSFDNGFFSRFQSAFIHYSETKHVSTPDYVATHAMVIDRELFLRSGGFKENWLPILEDVEFSHRLKRMGDTAVINPELLVRHIFNFSLAQSVRNAIRKASYWTFYSMKNKDMLSDSGTASRELKLNVVCFYLTAMFLMLAFLMQSSVFFLLAALAITINVFCSRGLLLQFQKNMGFNFKLGAPLYYLFFYPVPVSVGGVIGVSRYLHLSYIRRMS